jgi:hypothetical protein
VQPKGRNGCDLHIVSEYGTRDLDGIEIDSDSFAAMPDVITRVQRPHCRGRHNWSKYDAFLQETALTSAPVLPTKRDCEG